MVTDKEIDPARWVEEHGDILYRFTLGRVRDPILAEDLVQDTFLAALKGRDSFSGRSSERTWLVGILKHKIIDHFRKAKREVLSDQLELREQPVDDYLDRKGKWKLGQEAWVTNPEKAYERKELWTVLNRCIDHLNERQKKIYVLRELQEHDTARICEDLDISSSNLWVLLHRARLQLKECMQINWFNTQESDA